MGWSERNVNNMSKLRIAKENNESIEEIIKDNKKVIEFKKSKK